MVSDLCARLWRAKLSGLGFRPCIRLAVCKHRTRGVQQRVISAGVLPQVLNHKWVVAWQQGPAGICVAFAVMVIIARVPSTVLQKTMLANATAWQIGRIRPDYADRPAGRIVIAFREAV